MIEYTRQSDNVLVLKYVSIMNFSIMNVYFLSLLRSYIHIAAQHI